MTPFPIERMEHVLSRTTSAEHGFPLMLRHRLQCRILRAGQPDSGSSGDLAHHQLVREKAGYVCVAWALVGTLPAEGGGREGEEVTRAA